ncbi:MAG: phosphoribulokinase [Betaproteobacteria bacterium]|nr:phosphoribulokinase [Betaproteobacteria bacterium]
MSVQHPIIAVTGSSGAGTTTVRHAFGGIFRRQGVNAVFVEGDSYFRYARSDMQQAIAHSMAEGSPISHFGPEANDFERLETLFREYARSGTGTIRHYVKDAEQPGDYEQEAGTFTPWEEIPAGSDLLFYEGMHGGVVASTWARRRMDGTSSVPPQAERRKRDNGGVDVAQHVDLLLGVVPIVNLEWIQKIHRDCSKKHCSAEAVTATILRRMGDYVHFIAPQFSLTHINFQRVPFVDTSNPFIARDIPTLDESFVVIRFREHKQFDFPSLLQRIDGSFMSRPNTLVVPGGKMGYAMEIICTPLIHEMMDKKAKAARSAGRGAVPRPVASGETA